MHFADSFEQNEFVVITLSEPRFSRPADDDEPEEEDGASLPSLEGIKHNLNLSSSSASSSSSSSSSSQSGKWFLYTLKCRNQKFFVGRAASRVFKPLIHFAVSISVFSAFLFLCSVLNTFALLFSFHSLLRVNDSRQGEEISAF